MEKINRADLHERLSTRDWGIGGLDWPVELFKVANGDLAKIVVAPRYRIAIRLHFPGKNVDRLVAMGISTLSAAQAAPTHDGYKGSAVNLSIGRLCYVR